VTIASPSSAWRRLVSWLWASSDFLVVVVVDQPILPFAVAVGAHGRVERMVGRRQAAVHLHDVLLRHVEVGGDLLHRLGLQVAFLELPSSGP
jgi:hypothetical protein